MMKRIMMIAATVTVILDSHIMVGRVEAATAEATLARHLSYRFNNECKIPIGEKRYNVKHSRLCDQLAARLRQLYNCPFIDNGSLDGFSWDLCTNGQAHRPRLVAGAGSGV